jgi:hypothetical protein
MRQEAHSVAITERYSCYTTNPAWVIEEAPQGQARMPENVGSHGLSVSFYGETSQSQ